jgi:hypothetical protein
VIRLEDLPPHPILPLEPEKWPFLWQRRGDSRRVRAPAETRVCGSLLAGQPPSARPLAVLRWSSLLGVAAAKDAGRTSSVAAVVYLLTLARITSHAKAGRHDDRVPAAATAASEFSTRPL